MSEPEISFDPTSLTTNVRRKRSSSGAGILIGFLLGMTATATVFYLLSEGDDDSGRTNVAATDAPLAVQTGKPAAAQAAIKGEQDVIRERPESPTVTEEADRSSADGTISRNRLPLFAERPIVDEISSSPERNSGASSAPVTSPAAKEPEADGGEKPDEKQSIANPKNESKETDKNEAPKHKEIELSDRRWTTLVLLRGNQRGDAPLPEDFPIWNYEKGYAFAGSGADQHRLGNFRVDGEFLIRNGYLRREFGNSALLHLPAAQNFELEGIIHLAGVGGWMVLLGWDDETKSGYVVYNTRLKVSGSSWFVIEIKNGKPVAKSERLLVRRDAQGEGPLRIFVDDKKVSMQAAGAYLFREEKLPNYQAGHVAIGTFSPQYGPQNIGIRSLRMRLR